MDARPENSRRACGLARERETLLLGGHYFLHLERSVKLPSTDIRMSRRMHDVSLILSAHVFLLSINDNIKTDRGAYTASIPNCADMRKKHCIS